MEIWNLNRTGTEQRIIPNNQVDIPMTAISHCPAAAFQLTSNTIHFPRRRRK